MWKNTLWLTWPCLLSQPKDLSDNSWNFQELVEHPPKVTMLADWPSIAEGFPKACSQVTSYTIIIFLFVNFCFKSFFFFFFWLLLPINSYTYAACQQISKPLIKVLCSFFIHNHQFLHVKEQSIQHILKRKIRCLSLPFPEDFQHIPGKVWQSPPVPSQHI